MAEGTYEYECMRAELLGIDKPDFNEFMKNKTEKEEQDVDEEKLDVENLQEVDLQDETLQNTHGRLNELNNILKSTQQKINRFRSSCGSLTNILKIKIGHGSSDSLASNASETENATTTADVSEKAANIPKEAITNPENGTSERKSDLATALDRGLDNLDRMIEKSETAEYTMAYQNKQMRGFLKK